MIVYKYYALNNGYFWESLRENYVWFSKPSEFNDPFDCYECLMTFKPSEDDLKELLADEETRREVLANDARLCNLLQQIVKKLFSEYGVCCFSLTPGNLLLWSHYADKHRGVCVGFETNESPDVFDGYPVRYKNDFEAFNYFESKQAAFTNLLMTKSKDWEYEKEYRLFRESNGAVHYSPAALKTIIYGWKTPITDRQRISQVLQEVGISPVIKQAIPKQDSFALAIRGLIVQPAQNKGLN